MLLFLALVLSTLAWTAQAQPTADWDITFASGQPVNQGFNQAMQPRLQNTTANLMSVVYDSTRGNVLQRAYYSQANTDCMVISNSALSTLTMSFCLWVNFASNQPALCTTMIGAATSGPSDTFMYVCPTYGQYADFVGIQNGNAHAEYDQNNIFVVNTWYHLCTTYNGNNFNTATVYINGQQESINSVGGTPSGPFAQVFSVGAFSTLSGSNGFDINNVFVGKIDRPQGFYGVVLTPSQVSAIYAEPISTLAPTTPAPSVAPTTIQATTVAPTVSPTTVSSIAGSTLVLQSGLVSSVTLSSRITFNTSSYTVANTVSFENNNSPSVEIVMNPSDANWDVGQALSVSATGCTVTPSSGCFFNITIVTPSSEAFVISFTTLDTLSTGQPYNYGWLPFNSGSNTFVNRACSFQGPYKAVNSDNIPIVVGTTLQMLLVADGPHWFVNGVEYTTAIDSGSGELNPSQSTEYFVVTQAQAAASVIVTGMGIATEPSATVAPTTAPTVAATVAPTTASTSAPTTGTPTTASTAAPTTVAPTTTAATVAPTTASPTIASAGTFSVALSGSISTVTLFTPISFETSSYTVANTVAFQQNNSPSVEIEMTPTTNNWDVGQGVAVSVHGCTVSATLGCYFNMTVIDAGTTDTFVISFATSDTLSTVQPYDYGFLVYSGVTNRAYAWSGNRGTANDNIPVPQGTTLQVLLLSTGVHWFVNGVEYVASTTNTIVNPSLTTYYIVTQAAATSSIRITGFGTASQPVNPWQLKASYQAVNNIASTSFVPRVQNLNNSRISVVYDNVRGYVINRDCSTGNGYSRIAMPTANFPSSAYTISMWVSIPSAQASSSSLVLLGNSGPATNTGGDYNMTIAAGVVTLQHGSTFVYSSTATVPVNTWTHIAATYNSATSQASIFFNGILVSMPVTINSVVTNQGLLSALSGVYSAQLFVAHDTIFDVYSTGSGFCGFVDLPSVTSYMTSSAVASLYASQTLSHPVDIKYTVPMNSTSYYGTIHNDIPRQNASGVLFDLNDGNVMYYQGIYYWYGVAYENCVELLPDGSSSLGPGGSSSCTTGGFCSPYTCGFDYDQNVNVAWSYDLVNWQYSGIPAYNALAQYSALGQVSLFRPSVTYNAAYNYFVMWINNFQASSNFKVVYAISSTPLGPFVSPSQPGNSALSGTWDISTFADDNGSGYMVLTGDGGGIHVAPLSSDYTQVVTGSATLVASNTMTQDGITFTNSGAVEAPSMSKLGGKYYVVISTGCGFCAKGSVIEVLWATTPLGTYTSAGVINYGAAATVLYSNTINGFFLGPIGMQSNAIFRYTDGFGNQQLMLLGNRWSTAPDGLKSHDMSYWSPVNFTDSTNTVVVPFSVFVEKFNVSVWNPTTTTVAPTVAATSAPTTVPPTTSAATTIAPTTTASPTTTPTTANPTNASTTATPTTHAPTTATPTTHAPTVSATTVVPTTMNATAAATTVAPTTAAASTQPVSTQAATTQTATTQASTTQAASTQAASTQAPTTQAATTQIATTQTATTQIASTQAPSTQAATTQAASTPQPSTASNATTLAPTTSNPTTTVQPTTTGIIEFTIILNVAPISNITDATSLSLFLADAFASVFGISLDRIVLTNIEVVNSGQSSSPFHLETVSTGTEYTVTVQVSPDTTGSGLQSVTFVQDVLGAVGNNTTNTTSASRSFWVFLDNGGVDITAGNIGPAVVYPPNSSSSSDTWSYTGWQFLLTVLLPGVVIVLLLILAIVWCCRRKKDAENAEAAINRLTKGKSGTKPTLSSGGQQGSYFSIPIKK